MTTPQINDTVQQFNPVNGLTTANGIITEIDGSYVTVEFENRIGDVWEDVFSFSRLDPNGENAWEVAS